MSKSVKKPKDKLTQEDIDREDDQLITTLIDRFSGGQPFSKNEGRLGTPPPMNKRGATIGPDETLL